MDLISQITEQTLMDMEAKSTLRVWTREQFDEVDLRAIVKTPRPVLRVYERTTA